MMTVNTQKKIGLAIGIPFTVLVLGLIIYGNFIGKSSNPVESTWEYRPVLHVCDNAPAWAQPNTEEFVKALAFWETRGWAFENIEVGPCPDLCTGRDEDGNETQTTCKRGKVTIDLFSGDYWKEDHAGVCVKPTKESLGKNDWATIMVPPVVYGDDFAENAPLLPADVEAQVLAHEVGHCLVGLGHNIGPVVIPGCATLDSKSGHVMNPNVYKGGWGDESIPPTPEDWE